MAQHRKGPTAKEIALERIAILFDQAYQNRADPVLADRYVAPAREIAMRRRLRMPREYRRSFCQVCHAYFVPGEKPPRAHSAREDHLHLQDLRCSDLVSSIVIPFFLLMRQERCSIFCMKFFPQYKH